MNDRKQRYTDDTPGIQGTVEPDKFRVLKEYFGYDSFRPGQDRLIDAILSGRDTLGILPTGGGKSVCFQVPALMFPGLTIVISPLISLMNDQVAALMRRGIPSALITSELTPYERDQVYVRTQEGRVKLLYVSPERLESAHFRRFVNSVPISFLCVDEAHCISQWGHEFRPSYTRIRDFLEELRMHGQDPVVAAFTATATPDVRSDIMDILGLRNPFCLATGFDRKNLYYEVRKPKDKWTELRSLLRKYRGFCGIVYCLTRKDVDALAKRLAAEGIATVRYHAGMTGEERRKSQEAWLGGEVPLIVATNAFGMGIDKPDVRFVIHYSLPSNVENYYQEAGRAGRDGLPADCILLYGDRDVMACRFFIRRTSSARLREKMREDLRVMREYAGCTGCLRAYMLEYFGEHAERYCGNCSSCLRTSPISPRPPKGMMDRELRKSLVRIRYEIAEEHGKQPWQIFTERTLDDLARVRPETTADFLAIEGAGLFHVLRYGRPFLEEIRTWMRS